VRGLDLDLGNKFMSDYITPFVGPLINPITFQGKSALFGGVGCAWDPSFQINLTRVRHIIHSDPTPNPWPSELSSYFITIN